MVGAIVATVALGACGGGSSKQSASKGTGTGTADTTPTTVSTALGPGVTASDVKVGVMLIDYGCIEQFVDQVRPDEQKTYDIFFNDLNAKHALPGRTIVPVYKSYCPTNMASELAACTSLTEDAKVFAAIGTFFDPSGDAQLCFTKRHKTPIVSTSFAQPLGLKTPGMMVTPDISPERRLNVIMSLLKSQHTLDGKKVGTLAQSANRARVTKVVAPALKDMGVERGTDGALTISGQDTAAAQSQLDSIIERWKSDGTNAVVLVGEDVANKQFVQKIKRALPDLLLISDTTAILDSGRDLVKAKTNPNPYDGAISAEGQTGLEHTKTEHFTYCAGIWTKATRQPAPSPNKVVKLGNGKENDVYGGMEDACLYTNFFATIAKKVGPYLNAANWVQTVDNFGAIDDMSTIYASIHRGKYDADDTYGLVAFDPSIPQVGDWKHLTPVQNVSG
jgi:hypothetical protein